MVRTKDEDISLLGRSQRANKRKVDLFVSIHANSAPQSYCAGIEALCVKKDTTNQHDCSFINMNKSSRYSSVINSFLQSNAELSHKLAQGILDSTVSYLQLKNFDVRNRGIKCNGWQVLLHNRVPATIVETGYLSNPQEAMRLANGAYQELLAFGIAQGIKKFLSNCIMR